MRLYLHRKQPGQYDHELLWGCIALPAALALGVTIALLGSDNLSCRYRQLTGYRCPGCGFTHALLHLIRGEPAAAFRSNAAAVLLIWATLGYIAYAVATVVFRLPRIRLQLSPRQRLYVAACILVGLLAFWAYRIHHAKRLASVALVPNGILPVYARRDESSPPRSNLCPFTLGARHLQTPIARLLQTHHAVFPGRKSDSGSVACAHLSTCSSDRVVSRSHWKDPLRDPFIGSVNPRSLNHGRLCFATGRSNHSPLVQLHFPHAGVPLDSAPSGTSLPAGG
ncbi:MAG TPA: DUF2752 domain-containing protein [Kiritimatiellae bacterium]|nr:DUF2752 domain-containing protein [Kiritimatiellia bacterium]